MKRGILTALACAVLTPFLIWLYIWSQTSGRLNRAQRFCLRNETELVAETKKLLHDTLTSKKDFWFGDDTALPEGIRSMNAQVVKIARGGGAVNVKITGGHWHSGIVIVGDKNVFDPQHLPTDREQISPNLWKYIH